MNRKDATALKALENRMKLADNNIIDHSDCEECLEEYLFRFSDGNSDRYIGLKTILQCFEIAGEKELIPTLPFEWWIPVKTRYD